MRRRSCRSESGGPQTRSGLCRASRVGGSTRTSAVRDGKISIDDPRADVVRELLERHLAFADARSPAEDVHALDANGLLDPAVAFFSFRIDGELLGVGALRQLDRHHEELRGMHTAESARRRGVGRAMVDHLSGVARDRGVRQVSLETGSMQAFAPARTLYATKGFVPCRPFGEYRESPNSTFMTLFLDGAT